MDSKDKDFDQLLEKLTASTRSPRGRFSAEDSWELLEQRISPPVKKRKLWRIAGSVAASVLLCLASWFTYDYVQSTATQTVSTLAEVSTVTLPDQTTVTLNRYSSLSYPARFRGSKREVRLKGEAYFEVKRDVEHPFIVKVESVQVQVLGTHFNVEAYPGDEKIRTTLLEGSVAVSVPGERMVLSPNESAVYNRAEKKLLHEMTPESRNEIDWCDGHLIFDNLPLQEIARRLSHTFNLKIIITDPTLEHFRIRARFTDGEDLEQILNLLQEAGNFTYTKTNDTITIRTKQN